MFNDYAGGGITAWELLLRKDVLAARLRGRIFRLLGRVSGDNSSADLLIGSHERSYFERNGRLILDKKLVSPPLNSPSDFNSCSYSVGILNPRRYQNPPNRVSRFRMMENSSLRLGLHSRVGPGFYFSVGPSCEVSIGPWTYIGSDFDLYVRVGATIGQHCMISHGVCLMDYDGHSIVPSNSETRDTSNKDTAVDFGKAKAIVIEDHVWIGAGVKILKGVRIGKGSVIGMNSCLTRDIPPNSLVCGNPATVAKTNITWKHF